MSDAASGPTTPTTPPAGCPEQRARHARTDPAVTTRRWAIGVLLVATLAVLALGLFLDAVTWALLETFDIGGGRDWLAMSAATGVVHTLPALLVGWCTGLAASAVLARGEALGPRLAGVAAGSLGAALGAAVLALTGL